MVNPLRKSLTPDEKHFLIHFLASFALMFLLIKILPLEPLNLLVAQAQEAILSNVGLPVARAGTLLTVGSTVFQIVVDCSGLVMIILFLSLVYSTKTKTPVSRILLYSVFFFLFNLGRLAFTLAIGAIYGMQALDLLHPALWVVDSGVVFAAWAREFGLF